MLHMWSFLSVSHCVSGSGNVLKVQQLLHICSEHFDNKDKEEDKDKKDKKDKDKKEASSDMGSHQVCVSGAFHFVSLSNIRLTLLFAAPCRVWRCWVSLSSLWVRRSVQKWPCEHLVIW